MLILLAEFIYVLEWITDVTTVLAPTDKEPVAFVRLKIQKNAFLRHFDKVVLKHS